MNTNCKGLGKTTCNKTDGCKYAEGDKRSYCRSVARNPDVFKATSYQKKVISVKPNKKKEKPVKEKQVKKVKKVKKTAKKVIPVKQFSNKSLKNIIPVKPISNEKSMNNEDLARWYQEQH